MSQGDERGPHWPFDGRVIVHRWTPGPEWDSARAHVAGEIADEYVVVRVEDYAGAVMVWVRWGDRWHPNGSSRALLAHLLGVELLKVEDP